MVENETMVHVLLKERMYPTNAKYLQQQLGSTATLLKAQGDLDGLFSFWRDQSWLG